MPAPIKLNPVHMLNHLPRLNITSMLHNTLLGKVQGQPKQPKNLFQSMTGSEADEPQDMKAEMKND